LLGIYIFYLFDKIAMQKLEVFKNQYGDKWYVELKSRSHEFMFHVD